MGGKINKYMLNIWEAKHLVFNRDDLADKIRLSSCTATSTSWC